MVVARHREEVLVGEYRMSGQLRLPADCTGLVLLGHAGGMITQRTAAIGSILREAGFGTLTLALQRYLASYARPMVINTANLVSCLIQALDWMIERPDLAGLRRGLMLGGIGATAALQVDSMRPGRIDAIVAYGGRLDILPDEVLSQVVAPTLLIVGGDDPELVRLNRRSLSRLNCIRRLEVLPCSSHEMQQPGALDNAAHLAVEWFTRELRPRHAG